MNIIFDKVFDSELAESGRLRISLPELLVAIDDGSLVALTAMLPHQRPGVVTVLGILHAVLRFHLCRDRASAEDYAVLWCDTVGMEAGELFADFGKPAFLQPPLQEEPTVARSLSGIDLAFAQLSHEIKPRPDDGSEVQDWLFALMSGQLRIFVKDNPSGARWGVTCVLPSDGKTLASEISALSAAYRRRMALAPDDRDTIVGMRASPGGPRNHFVWLRPWSRAHKVPLSVIDLPYPFLEAPRPVRLLRGAGGAIQAVQLSLSTPRIEVKGLKDSGFLGDPHIPLFKSETPYRVAKGRRFDVRYLHAVLYGLRGRKDDKVVDPVPIMREIDRETCPLVRVCAVGTDRGKTLGYHERLLPRPPIDDWDESAAERLTRLSSTALTHMDKLSRLALRPAVRALLVGSRDKAPPAGRKDMIAAFAEQVQRRFEQEALEPTVAWVNAHVGRPPDPFTEQADLLEVLQGPVRGAFDFARSLLTARRGDGPLRLARAEHVFNAGVRMVFERHTAASLPSPPERFEAIARQIGQLRGALRTRAGEDTEEAKKIRTLYRDEPSLAFYDVLQNKGGVPAVELLDPKLRAAWMTIVKGMANLPHRQPKPKEGDDGTWALGDRLRRLELPDFRMQRLLDAQGDTLRGMVEELWRFVAVRAPAMDWRLPAALLLADAAGDDEVARWCRDRLALAFCRKPNKNNKKTEASVRAVS